MKFNKIFRVKKYLLLGLVIFSFSIYVNGQKKKVVSPNKAKPSVKQVAIVEIDENSKLKIFSEIEKNNSSDEPQIPDTVSGVTIIDFNQKIPLKLLGSGNIIIRATANLKYEKVVNLINKIRSQTKQNIKVEFSNDLFAKIPKLPAKADLLSPPKPNPLTLVVTLEKNRKITLNNEEMGTIHDLSQLKRKLAEVFKNRADEGVFRVGSNDIETSIYIKAPLSVNFSDIVRIAEALKDSGSSQIGLQVDDLQP